MLVSHRDDYDTHAVIGGKGVQEFGIAQTAEFFTVLSNTLYSNKPLAVIREVLCNAWDAQIVAGKTDVPVIITIDEDKLSIRDHGHGIPHDLIHAIYCIYGNSTKENDGNQTGGFGLGSKSPFAYSDHFTVNNHHDGLKTIHAISRGSALTQGKPDRRVMVSVPTTETGVEVVIPVKDKQDMHQFIEIARDVAAFGEMNVLINGKQVEVVPISKAENNMFLTTRSPRGVHQKICIRYGNVVYPVMPDAEYIGVYEKLMKLLKDIPDRNQYNKTNNPFHLIIQAPANSISVTPSRESLSNTETTINTIKKLFSALIDHMQTGNELFEQLLLDEQEKAAYYLINKGKMERLYFSENLLTDQHGPKTVGVGPSDATQITNMIELADYYLRYKQKLSDKIKAKLEAQRISILLKNGARHAHKLKLYRSMDRDGLEGVRFRDLIMRPLLRHVAKHEVLNHRSLNIVTPQHRGDTRMGWADYSKYIPDNRNFLKLLQGLVVVTHNKLAYEEQWDDLVGDASLFPNNIPRMVYVAPRTKGHKEAAVELFTKLGYFVVDFASICDEHREAGREPVVKGEKTVYVAPARPRNQGLVLLSHNVTDGKYKHFSINKHMTEGAPRSPDYDYVLKPHQLSGSFGKKFFPWGDAYAEQLVSFFGSKIGICINDPQLESQRKRGKKDALFFITQQISEKVLNTPEIRTYVENQKGLERRHANFDTLLEMAKHSTALHNAYGLPKTSPSEDDLIYYRIFESITSDLRMDYYVKTRPNDDDWRQPIWDAYQVIKTWAAAPAYTLLNERIQNSEGIKFLDLYDMLYALRNMSKTDPDYRKKVFIETSVINALSF